MAFESLTERMSQAFKNLTGQGKLTEKNMNDMLKEVRMSLLEADVNYTVVKDFIARVKETGAGRRRCMQCAQSGADGRQGRSRGDHGAAGQLKRSEVHYKKSGITTLMMVGLQGTGKTTASAKIANLMKKKQRQKTAARCLRRRASGSDRTAADAGREHRCRGVYPGRGDRSALETARQRDDAMRRRTAMIPCCSIRPDDCISMKN